MNSICLRLLPEVTGVTFFDSDSPPVPKCLNPAPEIFQIWESDSCSDSGYNRYKRNLSMLLAKKWDSCYLKVTRVRFFPNFWPRIRKKNAESCRSRLRIHGHLWLLLWSLRRLYCGSRTLFLHFLIFLEWRCAMASGWLCCINTSDPSCTAIKQFRKNSAKLGGKTVWENKFPKSYESARMESFYIFTTFSVSLTIFVRLANLLKMRSFPRMRQGIFLFNNQHTFWIRVDNEIISTVRLSWSDSYTSFCAEIRKFLSYCTKYKIGHKQA